MCRLASRSTIFRQHETLLGAKNHAVPVFFNDSRSVNLEVDSGVLKVPVGERRYFDVPLNKHTQEVLSEAGLKVRSFTLTARSVCLTISREVKEIQCTGTAGLDRNLRNLTYGNEERVIQYDLSKAVKIAERGRKR